MLKKKHCNSKKIFYRAKKYIITCLNNLPAFKNNHTSTIIMYDQKKRFLIMNSIFLKQLILFHYKSYDNIRINSFPTDDSNSSDIN